MDGVGDCVRPNHNGILMKDITWARPNAPIWVMQPQYQMNSFPSQIECHLLYPSPQPFKCQQLNYDSTTIVRRRKNAENV